MSKKNLVVNTWVEEFSELLSRETFKLIKESIKDKDDKSISKVVASKYLKNFVKHVIISSLTEHKAQKMTNQQAYEYTRVAFDAAKSEMQHAIAEGYEKAFEEFSGRFVEYYCIIKPVPEPINKQAC